MIAFRLKKKHETNSTNAKYMEINFSIVLLSGTPELYIFSYVLYIAQYVNTIYTHNNIKTPNKIIFPRYTCVTFIIRKVTH